MNPFLNSIYTHSAAGKAILATNFYNAETLMAVIEAARQEKSEIILQTSPSTLSYLNVPLAAAMARAAAVRAGVRAWLHLDHANDPDLIRACVDAGYDSVMIDASNRPFADNVRQTRAIVEMAHERGVAVEAELGVVPKLGESAPEGDRYTSVEEAIDFVAQTNVDLLAVAIGTAHGFYKDKPKLALDRLESLHSALDIPLVLHGGSDLSEEAWQGCIRRGIAKVNFATEIKDTFTRGVKTALSSSDDIDLRRTFQPAMKSVTQLVARKIQICSMSESPVHA